MKRKEGVFLSETKLSKQQICDILVLLRLMLENADGSIVRDNEITLRYGGNVINIPRKSSIYEMIKKELE